MGSVLYIDAATLKKLRDEAERQARPMAQVLRFALDAYLAQPEASAPPPKSGGNPGPGT